MRVAYRLVPHTCRVDKCLHLKSDVPRSVRPAGFEDDLAFSESLVEAFLEEFTRPGDLVLDPFAGFGTTLVVAERMGRRALGLEILSDRVAFIRNRLSDPSSVIEADARQLHTLGLGAIDFVMTSPPYMTRESHPQNPFTGYRTLDGDYAAYLADLRGVFDAVAAILRPGGSVVVNVANLRGGGHEVTPLAWDVTAALSSVLQFEREIVLCWDVDQPALTNDYCMVFVGRP